MSSTHKWPVTRKMFPFDDVIMYSTQPGLIPALNQWWIMETSIAKGLSSKNNIVHAQGCPGLCKYDLGRPMTQARTITAILDPSWRNLEAVIYRFRVVRSPYNLTGVSLLYSQISKPLREWSFSRFAYIPVIKNTEITLDLLLCACARKICPGNIGWLCKYWCRDYFITSLIPSPSADHAHARKRNAIVMTKIATFFIGTDRMMFFLHRTSLKMIEKNCVGKFAIHQVMLSI